MKASTYLLLFSFTLGFTQCSKPSELNDSPLAGNYLIRRDASGKSVAPNTDPIPMPTDETSAWNIAINPAGRMQLTNQHGYTRQATIKGQAFILDTLQDGSELYVGRGYFKGDSVLFSEIQNRAGSPYNYVVSLLYRGIRTK